MYYVWTRIFSALNSCQIRKNRLYTLLHVMKFYIVKLREREGQRVDLGRSRKGHL